MIQTWPLQFAMLISANRRMALIGAALLILWVLWSLPAAWRETAEKGSENDPMDDEV